MIISVDQSPLTITPSNGEHVYTLSSTGYTLSNFKYIMDIYLFTYPTQTYTPDNRVARLKVSANSYGKCIVELNEIVRTLLKPNPRASGTTYPYLNYVSDENTSVTLINATNTFDSNAYNWWPGGSPNGNLDQLFHVAQYQVIVGGEYLSGNTIVEEIDTSASYQPARVSIFPGVDNSLIPQPTLYNVPDYLSQDTNGWLYYDLFRHQFNQEPLSQCNPKEFLTSGYYNDCNVAIVDNTPIQNTRRRKHHPDCPIVLSFLNGKNDYFINDTYSITIRASDDYGSPYTYSAEGFNRTSTTVPSTNEPSDSLIKYFTFYLPYNVTQQGTNVIPPDVKKVGFYSSSYQASNRMLWSNSTSEFLEYYIQPYDCLASPIHVLFLNSQGVWDTYTFGGKSERKIDVERKQYRQEMSLNKQFYSRGSSNRGTTIYDHDAEISWTCKSWYMEDSDVHIVEQIFQSNDVFIITGTTINPSDCESCLGEIRLYQHLIPVTIEDKSFTEIKKKYNKLYQYEFTLKYGGLKRYRLPG